MGFQAANKPVFEQDLAAPAKPLNPHLAYKCATFLIRMLLFGFSAMAVLLARCAILPGDGRAFTILNAIYNRKHLRPSVSTKTGNPISKEHVH